MFEQMRNIVDYLTGATDVAPSGFKVSLSSPLWGVYWAFLILLILIFSGQSSKFIYIDF
ncbi:MAG: hypothetical protein H8F28_17720 [Fibrella sp.]|nr:hypothetical protein [Armatimonadota bacterium]